jgi:hypothetical protein
MKYLDIPSTVQLCKLGKSGNVLRLASGCFVRVGSKKILLTVEHATGDNGNWAIQLFYDKEKGTAHHLCGQFNFVTSGTLDSGVF